MRELEFLPGWYPQTRRRKRIIAIEGYIVAGLILVLGGWVAFAQRSVRTRELKLHALEQQLDTAYSKEQLLNKQLALRQQLSEREELIASLGYPVELTRLLQTLDSVMPKEMTILELDCQTREVARPVSTVAAVFKPNEKKQVDRRLDIKLRGVTPDDSDIGNLLSELQKRPFFEQLNVTTINNRTDDGHRMREFEVTFSMNLNQ
jgi:hypothetical protein